MHITFALRWLFGPDRPEEIDEALFVLLEAVRAEGSLTRAARASAVSYRHAWGLIRKWENRFHTPLLHMRRGRGRGARLSELGERLMLARHSLGREFSEKLDLAAVNLGADLQPFTRLGRAKTLRIIASHDLGMMRVAELICRDTGLEVQLQTRGSVESLRLLARSECTAAGFHLPLGPLRQTVLPAYARWLRGRPYTLLLVAKRQQGLITQQANSKRIHSLKDLTRRSVRFVNRQPESGTRLILDGLLKLEKIDAGRIRGYRTEEFTHTAVAAMVAGGAADAGFGIAAGAAEFRLRFVPLVEEEYFLALSADASEMRRMLRRILRSPAYRTQLRQMPGYDAERSGREGRFEEFQAAPESRRLRLAKRRSRV
jgi:molybdate transport repressor ModE-like protein